MDLSIVIVNYNVKHFLEQCLMAIERARRDLKIEIFIVDNASVDGSPAMIKKKFPQVKLIENHRNLGFSKANNQALRLCQGRYILLLNPDTLIQEDTLVELIRFLESRPKAGAVGCMLINPDGSFQAGSRRSLPTPWVAFTRIVGLSRIFPHSPIFGRYNLTYIKPDRETEIDVLSGSLMMLRREAIAGVNYFDEDYFMYGEDIDLCYRIKQAGWQIFYTPRTKAIHYKGESSKRSEFSYLANFYSAMLIFINKHFPTRYSRPVKYLIALGIVIRAWFSYLFRFLKIIAAPLFDLALIMCSIFLGIKLWLPLYHLGRFRVIFPAYSLIWITALYLSGAYAPRGKYHLKPLISGALLGLLVNATFTYFFKQFAYSRVVILISFGLIVLGLGLWRVVYRVFGPYAIKHPLSKLRRAIIVGSGKEGLRILKKLRKRPDLPFEICGFVDFDEKNVGREIDGTEVLATIENIREVIRVEGVSDVIFSSDRISNEQILETIANARQSGVSFRIVPHQLEYIVAKSAVEEIDAVPLIDFVGAYDPIDYMVKRMLDFLLASLAVILTFPLLIINFLFGGRITSRPIITESGREKRISRFSGGIPFLKNLPLFFSVLNGKISIVGSDLTEAETSGRRPFYKPGMTGLVQIKVKERGKALNHDEKDYFNLYYLKNRSILTDLQILFSALIR
jgi:GT2 family glycosyltransferase/lipopolysaccharide/colanic/teichoic acid biosynthesis glycosyltransferase